MPCNSAYLEPTKEEQNRKLICQLIVFVHKKLNWNNTHEDIVEAANHVYGNGVKLEDVVPFLCNLLSSLTDEQQETIIYNGKDKMSRKLADWWEEHLEADRKRISTEIQEAKNERAKKKALAKLTNHERKLLNL